MNKVLDELAERFNQDPFETYFFKQYPPGAWKDSMTLAMSTLFKYSSQ